MVDILGIINRELITSQKDKFPGVNCREFAEKVIAANPTSSASLSTFKNAYTAWLSGQNEYTQKLSVSLVALMNSAAWKI